MGEVRSFFDSFREFIWDIIGYLIPGAYLIILVSYFIKEDYFIPIPEIFKGNELLVLIVMSYILGHVIYGLGDLKETIRGSSSYSKRILTPISALPVFNEIKRKLIQQNLMSAENTERLDVRGLRNVVMSYIPEADQKIYTFMFRSELSRHTGIISLIIGGLGLLFTILGCTDLNFILFKTDLIYALMYILLILSYFLLREPRDKFYRIAMTMAFNIFNAKNINKEND